MFEYFQEKITRNFDDELGLPMHLADPGRSLMMIMTEEEYRNKSAKELHLILKDQHLLVTDCDFKQCSLDEVSLASFSPLHREVTMTGEFSVY